MVGISTRCSSNRRRGGRVGAGEPDLAIWPIISSGASGSVPRSSHSSRACLARERDAALTHVVRPLKRDRLRDGEIRRRVARSLLLGARDECRRLCVAPADDRAVDPLLPLGSRVEETGALRRAQPFVAVTGIEVRAELLQVEVELRDGVRAVDDRCETFRTCAGDDIFDRQQQRGLGRDVRDEHGPRTVGLVFEEPVDRDAHVARPPLSRTRAPA